MCSDSEIVEKAIVIDVLTRGNEVTIADNNGIVITVPSNNIATALGTVLAENLLAAHNYYWKLSRSFDIKFKFKVHKRNG